MMDVMNTVDFQTQLTSIMEMLAKTAIVEIGKLFEENSSFVRLEISRCTNQIETLQQKCNLLESELQSARKTASEKMMNGTDDAFTHSTLTETGHRPAINNVFGKEWCMNMWRHEESDVGQKEEKHVDSSVITGEPVNLIDDEPDMIMIKEETLEECSIKNKTEEDQSNMLRGPAAASNDRCVAKTSDDFITYRLPSGDQVKSNVQQRQPKKKILDSRHSTHGDNASGSNLNHDEFVKFFPSNVNFNSTQNQTSVLEEKKFDCILCGKTFSYLSYLKVHMRIHSGEKPYVCSVCGKRFAQKTYLRIHQRTHSGERPYTCMECGKSFSQKSSLNVHLRSHTGEKPYNCVECGKSYAYKYGFNTHQCAC